jgi:hypothetical protein
MGFKTVRTMDFVDESMLCTISRLVLVIAGLMKGRWEM